MDRNEQSYSNDNIDTSHFYYLCDSSGHAVCQMHFNTPDAARKYYMKAHRKIPGGCFIGIHTTDIIEDSFIDK